MARRLRLEYPGAMYHVIQRGNNREFIFEGKEDKGFLRDLLYKAVVVDGVDLFAYVIMNNHYHLALRANEVPISKVMHRINTGYGMYYNREHKRSGHVFDGRYKSISVQKESHLISLIKYIHLNPVRAGICSNVREYPWSSDLCYRAEEKGFVECGLFLDILGTDRKKAVVNYNDLMEKEDDIDQYDETACFAEESSETHNKLEKYAWRRRPLEEILKETGVKQEEYELIRRGSRLRTLAAAKKVYAKNAAAQGYSLQETGRYIGVSAAAVFKYIYKP